MDWGLIGRIIRALRQHKGWRQADLAGKAQTSRSMISRLERGRIAGMRVETLDRIAKALDAQFVATVRWRGADLDRLLDARHASLGDVVTRLLTSAGWVVIPEATFSV